MLFTWTIESVLASLIFTVLVNSYISWSTVIVSCVTLLLQLICRAAILDKHEIIATAHLSAITGCLIVCVVISMDSVSAILSVACLGVLELIGVGMAFASTDEATPLFFSMRGHFTIVFPLILESMTCINVYDWSEFGSSVAMVYLAVQFAPFDAIAMMITVLMDCAVLALCVVNMKHTAAAVIGVKMLVTSIWLLRVWMTTSYPNVIQMDSALEMHVMNVKGPWLETALASGVVTTLIVLGIMQRNFMIMVPIIVCVLWIVLLWVFQSKYELLPTHEEHTSPAVEPVSTPKITTTMLNARRGIVWPRMRNTSASKEL